MEAFRGVADYRKSAAGLRTVLSKRGHENMTARPYRSANLLDIGLAISCMGEEMKNRAIVPDRVGVLELDSQDIRQHPLYAGGFRAETIPAGNAISIEMIAAKTASSTVGGMWVPMVVAIES